MSTVDKFPIPGVRQPGEAGDAAPGSVLAQLRQTAARKRAAKTLTVPLHGRWEGQLRVVYGVLGFEDMERAVALRDSGTSDLDGSLELVARAVRAIEAYDPETDTWSAIEDSLGPVSFDDRLLRLLDVERPGDDYVFSTRQAYEWVFDVKYDGIGPLIEHQGRVNAFMGLEERPGESSTGEQLTGSGSPQPSA
jgi:hypothetical protein